MTISEDDRRDVIEIRLCNANAMIEDARCLLGRGSLRSAANRAYYGAFYAVSALALHGGRTFRTHTGLIGFFHSEFVAAGKLEARYGRTVQEAFEDRSEADYEDVPVLDADRLRTRLSEVEDLIRVARTYIEVPSGAEGEGASGSH